MGFGPAHVLGHRRSPWWHHGDLLREERASCADGGTPERERLQGRQASEMRFNCITGLAVERDGSVLVCDHQPQRAVYHSPTFRNIWNMPRMPTAVSGPNRQPAIVCASSVFRDPDRENSVQAEIMRDPVTPTIPAGALPTMQSRREREYLHAKKDRPGRLGSEKIHLQLLAHSMGSPSGEATDIGRAAGVCD